MTSIDKVAEAIREASYDYWYEKQTLGCDSRGEEESRHIAEKVVQALGLTEQWGWQLGDEPPYEYPSREAAQERLEELETMVSPFRKRIGGKERPRRLVSRLVGLWGEDRREA